MKAVRRLHSSKYNKEHCREIAKMSRKLMLQKNEDDNSSEIEARFYAAKAVADKMTLEQLVDISEDFNVGYDVREGVFEVMLKIPINKLEKTK